MRLWPFLLLPLAFTPMQTEQTTGFKIVTLNTFGTGSNETTAYYLRDRSRAEYQNSDGGNARPGSAHGSYQMTNGPHMATIRRCDLGKRFFLNLDTHEYSESPDMGMELPKALAAARKTLKAASPRPPSKPTLRIETTTTDTGERKQIFGYTARRVIVTTKYVPLEGSNAVAQESTNDGWYIDIDTRLSCGEQYPPGTLFYSFAAGPAERIEFVRKGDAKLGFAISVVSSNKSSAAGKQPSPGHAGPKSETQVIQLQHGPLDPSLFEIPTDFKLVDHVNPNPIRPAQQPSHTESFWQRLESWLSAKF